MASTSKRKFRLEWSEYSIPGAYFIDSKGDSTGDKASPQCVEIAGKCCDAEICDPLAADIIAADGSLLNEYYLIRMPNGTTLVDRGCEIIECDTDTDISTLCSKLSGFVNVVQDVFIPGATIVSGPTCVAVPACTECTGDGTVSFDCVDGCEGPAPDSIVFPDTICANWLGIIGYDVTLAFDMTTAVLLSGCNFYQTAEIDLPTPVLLCKSMANSYLDALGNPYGPVDFYLFGFLGGLDINYPCSPSGKNDSTGAFSSYASVTAFGAWVTAGSPAPSLPDFSGGHFTSIASYDFLFSAPDGPGTISPTISPIWVPPPSPLSVPYVPNALWDAFLSIDPPTFCITRGTATYSMSSNCGTSSVSTTGGDLVSQPPPFQRPCACCSVLSSGPGGTLPALAATLGGGHSVGGGVSLVTTNPTQVVDGYNTTTGSGYISFVFPIITSVEAGGDGTTVCANAVVTVSPCPPDADGVAQENKAKVCIIIYPGADLDLSSTPCAKACAVMDFGCNPLEIDGGIGIACIAVVIPPGPDNKPPASEACLGCETCGGIRNGDILGFTMGLAP